MIIHIAEDLNRHWNQNRVYVLRAHISYHISFHIGKEKVGCDVLTIQPKGMKYLFHKYCISGNIIFMVITAYLVWKE